MGNKKIINKNHKKHIKKLKKAKKSIFFSVFYFRSTIFHNLSKKYLNNIKDKFS